MPILSLPASYRRDQSRTVIRVITWKEGQANTLRQLRDLLKIKSHRRVSFTRNVLVKCMMQEGLDNLQKIIDERYRVVGYATFDNENRQWTHYFRLLKADGTGSNITKKK